MEWVWTLSHYGGGMEAEHASRHWGRCAHAGDASAETPTRIHEVETDPDRGGIFCFFVLRSVFGRVPASSALWRLSGGGLASSSGIAPGPLRGIGNFECDSTTPGASGGVVCARTIGGSPPRGVGGRRRI